MFLDQLVVWRKVLEFPEEVTVISQDDSQNKGTYLTYKRMARLGCVCRVQTASPMEWDFRQVSGGLRSEDAGSPNANNHYPPMYLLSWERVPPTARENTVELSRGQMPTLQKETLQ